MNARECFAAWSHPRQTYVEVLVQQDGLCVPLLSPEQCYVLAVGDRSHPLWLWMVIIYRVGKMLWRKKSIGHACHVVSAIDVDRVHLASIIVYLPSDRASVCDLSMPSDAFDPLADTARSANEILEVDGYTD